MLPVERWLHAFAPTGQGPSDRTCRPSRSKAPWRRPRVPQLALQVSKSFSWRMGGKTFRYWHQNQYHMQKNAAYQQLSTCMRYTLWGGLSGLADYDRPPSPRHVPHLSVPVVLLAAPSLARAHRPKLRPLGDPKKWLGRLRGKRRSLQIHEGYENSRKIIY